MTRARLMVPVVIAAVASAPLAAQQRIDARTAVFFETYSFNTGLVFDRVTEITVPVGVNVDFGRFGTLALSTGYVTIELNSAVSQLADQTISGILDTEARYSYTVIPGRLVMLATGSVPTGIKTVQREELSILGAISSDIIGFAASTVGSGGSVGGGFAGAFPVGDWALGLGGTVREPLSYQAVVGETAELKPGTEFKFRTGLEGALARRTYLRVAGIVAYRAKDAVGGQTQNGVGTRFIGYVSVNHGIGSSSLTVYGFDVYRANAQLEPTATGAAVLPRGNLVVAGARLAIPLRRATSVTPRAEFRLSTAAPDAASDLRKAGQSLRFGADVRHRLNRRLELIFQGDGATGFVVQESENIGFTGFRAALHIEVTP